ncbi:MAG: hypothetical protein R2792_08460 [Saprospiraceae bacterium]
MRFKTSLFLLPFAFSICAFLLTLLACCKKEQNCPPDLPCATQTGENTFGCYIDGEPWVAGIAPYILDPTLHKFIAWYDETGYGDDNNNKLTIKVISVDSTIFDFITIILSGVYENTILIDNHSPNDIYAHISLEDSPFDDDYYLDTLYNYIFKFEKIDTSSNTIAGTFNFRTISEDGLDTIYITEGRFDKVYYPE